MRASASTAPDGAWLRAVPKAELHVHLDGSLRAGTMLELAAARGVALPERTPEALASYMLVSDAANLEDYLERFDVTLSVMQDAEALERVAFECVLDHAEEGVRYVEIRFCPLLNCAEGMTPGQVVDAALRGFERARRHLDADGAHIDGGIIVCALRSHTPDQTLEMAELSVEYHGGGVLGFDLAGPESGFPVRDHREAFDVAHRGGVPITIHAGEGYGPPSIQEALELGHAQRIGHGTRLIEDVGLLETVGRRRIPLEVCLTSNVQTRVVPSIASHPIEAYRAAGVPVVLSTDNRLMSGVSLTDEYERAVRAFGWTRADVLEVARTGFEFAFQEREVVDAHLTAFDMWSDA